MTKDEAQAEARRRWGPEAEARTHVGGVYVIHGPNRSLLGQGPTWEDALERAEWGAWFNEHPVWSRWEYRYEGLEIVAVCRECRTYRARRASPRQPLTPEDWERRAGAAEAVFLKDMRASPKTFCKHLDDVRFDRDHLLRFVRDQQKPQPSPNSVRQDQRREWYQRSGR